MELIALEIGFGLLIGILLGTIGGGGSILTVPILIYAIGLSVHDATATSLVIVGVTALLGVVPHWRQGNVHLRTGVTFGAAGILGAVLGTAINRRMNEILVLFLFGILMLLVAARMAFGKQPEPRGVDGQQALVSTLVAGAAVGVMTGFFGVGGGFLIVPALVLALGLPMREAVGTSLMIIAINSAAAGLARWGGGGFDFTVAAIFILGGFIGSQVGARIAYRLDNARLAKAFAALVLLVGLAVIMDSANTLFGG